MPEITTTLRTPNYASAPGSPTKGQLYYDTTANLLYFYNGTSWVAAGGGGSGSPGGSTTQVQFNDAGAFGGDAGLVYDKATDKLTIAGDIQMAATGTPALRAASNEALYFNNNGQPGITFYTGGAAADDFRMQSGAFMIQNANLLGWSAGPNSNPLDTALARNAAGVVEVNNGTAGSYRDLKLRTLTLSGGTTINVSAPSSATGLFLKDDGTWASAGGGGSVDDTAYASSWNGVTTTAPSKNAVYDELNKRAAPNIVVFTVGTSTYTPSAGARVLVVEAWGAGGGGGGAKGTGSAASAAGGGGGGGYAMKEVTGTLKGSYTYTVGAGGTGGAATPVLGNNGADTTFDSPSICTANGGAGGAVSGAASSTAVFHGNGGTTVLPSVCDMGMRGSYGGQGMVLNATNARGGDGGAAAMGGGGVGAIGGAGAAGTVGRQYGGGGAGAQSTSATGAAGGNGADGFLKITEYF